MTITKLGHSCLLIETDGTKILIDPGSYSNVPENVAGLDAILITHEHQDHLDAEKPQSLIGRSPNVRMLTTASVAKVLEEVKTETLKHGDTVEVGTVTIEALGEKHAVMHPDVPQSENIGFFIAGRLFHPGDALTNPDGPVEILALPVAGPWLKLADAIEYAKTVHPKVAFPIHDGILKQPGSVHTLPPKILEPLGVQWRILEDGKPVDF